MKSDKRPKYTFTGPFRLGVNAEEVDDGLRIAMVSDDSIAQASGLQQGDIITLWGDEKLTNRRELRRAIRRDKGKTITLKVMRDGEKIDLPLRLFRPDEDEA